MNRLGHERLDAYAVAVDVARWAARLNIPAWRKHLREQLVRAADSVVLNLAEGCGHPPGNARRNHYRIANGSAAEVAAIVDLLDPPDRDERLHQLRRVCAMLYRLSIK